MKKYEAPELFVDEFAPDSMIASTTQSTGPKNDNAGNNQNCAGCRETYGAIDPKNPENWCNILPDSSLWGWC